MAGKEVAIGDQLEEYRLLRPLGRGAMGQVFVAHDALLDRLVAIKLIGRRPSESLRERFIVEARAIARLHHPNVVVVYRVGESGGRPYLVSELVRGQPLDRIPRPVPWARLVELGLGLARGLAAAHRAGVLHRDIKPANAILADDGTVKLLDFGLAKLSERSHLTPAIVQPSAPLDEHAPEPTDPDSEATRTSAPGSGEAGWPPPVAAGGPLDQTSTLPPSPGLSPEDVAVAETHPPSGGLGDTPRSGGPSGGPSGEASTGVVGSPLYMAPELWQGAAASHASDLYALGMLLYELACGRAPHRGLAMLELVHRRESEDIPPLASVAPGFPAELGAVIDRCLQREPGARLQTADALREALESFVAQSTPAGPVAEPYPGLRAFEAGHRARFFGRAPDVRAVIDRLRSDRLVIVTGDSGVGKSSLCRAGVLPGIAEGELGGGYDVVSFRPGPRPLESAAQALAALIDEDAREALISGSGQPEDLSRALQARGTQTLLFVDQLEELVTLSPAIEARTLAERLGALVRTGSRVRVLATVRGEFLTRLGALPGLGEELARSLYLLRPLAAEALREVILGPLRGTGVRFESDATVEALVSAGAESAGLPLLQFTLSELWRRRDTARGVVPLTALAEIGGVAGALARHADGVLVALLPEARAAARRILLRLVTAEGTRASRPVASLEGLAGNARAALSALVDGRIVVVRDTPDGAVGELAHEALVSSWDTLRGWLEAQASQRAAIRRVEAATAEWRRLGRGRHALYAAPQLAEASTLDDDDLGKDELAFLRASRAQIRLQRRRRVAISLVGIIGLAGGIAATRLLAGLDVARRVTAHVTSARQLLAQAEVHAREASLHRATAFRELDRGQQAEGELAWTTALEADRKRTSSLDAAEHAFEAGLLLDGERDDIRRALGELIRDRALAAEAALRRGEHAALVARLELFDRDGSLRRALEAKTPVEVDTAPTGVAVALQRYDDAFRPGPEEPIGRTPLRTSLRPGSYLLTLRRTGAADVAYPLLVERAPAQVRVPLPRSVPDGFVHVPAGRSLVGSSADEELRAFFGATPLHAAEVPAYLVARHETTFAEYLAFLAALPVAERARRSPRPVAGVDASGAIVKLETGPRGPTLILRPTSRTYRAAAGEAIHYEGRKSLATQDWLRFPVAGISPDDARAYAAWVARVRLPGARLCSAVEWGRAARGADDRPFPHGLSLEPSEANIDATYGRVDAAFGPDAVGSHPASASPFGVEDLAGNVWELTADGGQFVMRGGGWYTNSTSARIENNQPVDADFRHVASGFRLCADASR